ncbi:MAG TPA: class I SAM-dependent rRNA methyltransferase, partial [Vicinamibacteria bacterium]
MIEGRAVVSRKGEARIQRGHPWIFRSDVARHDQLKPGALVEVLGHRDRTLGFAFFSSRSEIRLRMVSREAKLAATYLRDRLKDALRWRETVAAGADACRLVHGEGDGLPSLVVDRYGDYLVVQTLSQGTDRRKAEIADALCEELKPKGILARNDPKVRSLEGLEPEVALLQGAVPETVEIREGEVHLAVDLWRGQKTGLFLDQRENHLMARTYARGRVLDGFTYDGGFALQVAGQASSVLAVDLSAEALGRVRANAARNGFSNVETADRNVFDLLRERQDAGERFDTVILDPPAFAKSKSAVERAVRGYKD